MKRMTVLAVMAFLPALVGPALAQELMVYPAQGQSQEQMEQDKFTCYNWAKQQTGYDPMAVSQQSNQPPSTTSKGKSGGAGSGALKGAAGGAIGGAIAGDAGKGAAIGAGAGALLGGHRKRSEERSETQAQQQRQEQQAAEISQKRSDYTRAYSACLEGKGYSVK